MTPSPPIGFHARGGWFVRREPGGAGRIDAANWPGGPHLTLDANTWASAVASVSATGETGETHRRALAFHNGRTETR